MPAIKKTAHIGKECVACGACLKICPLQAIKVPNGIRAIVDEKKCVGCAKCAKTCPADVIRIMEVFAP